MALEQYRKKRNFAKTSEPPGKEAKRPGSYDSEARANGTGDSLLTRNRSATTGRTLDEIARQSTSTTARDFAIGNANRHKLPQVSVGSKTAEQKSSKVSLH